MQHKYWSDSHCHFDNKLLVLILKHLYAYDVYHKYKHSKDINVFINDTLPEMPGIFQLGPMWLPWQDQNDLLGRLLGLQQFNP